MSEKEVIVVEASSLEEAKMIAAQEWGISSSDVIVNLLEEEKKAFWHFGQALESGSQARLLSGFAKGAKNTIRVAGKDGFKCVFVPEG
ncbi:Jag N-terminal domain-containing protein [Acetomicrobium sp.]|uniref:Jag N-terminal domain-containing protein n=1 Tax=Acetomicrobium sp. TaxID=1872099 RepID=UPI0028710D15|nr:Jag N-terminal domain-containing protein [Acetomicrobium sp.]MDR9770980.1 Jag N-terminal domain-containing protein [Acetomicrobium sp.]